MRRILEGRATCQETDRVPTGLVIKCCRSVGHTGDHTNASLSHRWRQALTVIDGDGDTTDTRWNIIDNAGVVVQQVTASSASAAIAASDYTMPSVSARPVLSVVS